MSETSTDKVKIHVYHLQNKEHTPFAVAGHYKTEDREFLPRLAKLLESGGFTVTFVDS